MNQYRRHEYLLGPRLARATTQTSIQRKRLPEQKLKAEILGVFFGVFAYISSESVQRIKNTLYPFSGLKLQSKVVYLSPNYKKMKVT